MGINNNFDAVGSNGLFGASPSIVKFAGFELRKTHILKVKLNSDCQISKQIKVKLNSDCQISKHIKMKLNSDCQISKHKIA